jgi:6-phosphogluconolactonase
MFQTTPFFLVARCKKLVFIFIFLTAAIISFAQNLAPAPSVFTPNLLVGTYTKNGSKGIYVFNFDTATGKAIQLSHTDSATNPSFLAISKDKQFVYAVNETSSGMIATFSLNNNKLNLLQQKTTKGADPCYVTLSPDQHNIFVANYSS